MSKTQIKKIINKLTSENGLIDTKVKGVKLFKITEPIRCAPAVYEPSITAILSGSKEAILNGDRHVFNSDQYICCTTPMPIETGTPHSSIANPMIGVYISLDTKIMTELIIEMGSSFCSVRPSCDTAPSLGLFTAFWDDAFIDALYRLLVLEESPTDAAILGLSRLRELYYTILKGQTGASFNHALGAGNEIARSIEFLSSNFCDKITIEDAAKHIGMSRTVFHRKFKQATNISPIQFVKSMRLNNAAIRITEGININVAAMEVGYTSSSQFSREFKRLYGLSPKQWRQFKLKN